MKRVAVIGSTGQLGSDLVKGVRSEGYEVFPLSRTDVECVNSDSVQKAVGAIRPNTVINCAAYVRVDDCEERSAAGLSTVAHRADGKPLWQGGCARKRRKLRGVDPGESTVERTFASGQRHPDVPHLYL